MFIKKIHLSGVRCLIDQDLEFHPQLNIVTGSNGSGKSSLLEAITILLSGRSYRTKKTSQIFRKSSGGKDSSILITAKIEFDKSAHQLGYLRERGNQKVTIKQDRTRLSKASLLAFNHPFIIISPETTDFIDGSSEQRRSYLDWILFHIDSNYHQLISDYNKVLLQRNALLKSSIYRSHNSFHNELTMWNYQLSEKGEAVHKKRVDLVKNISSFWPGIIKSMSDDFEIKINYKSGWDNGNSLSEAIELALPTDKRRRFTSKGPHRADIEIISNTLGCPVKDVCSRGEKKLINIAMGLAQILYINHISEKRSILLVDDFYAEFDADRVVSVITKILSLGIQVFLTTPRSEDLKLINQIENKKVFHLNEGSVEEVVYSR
jgi:DNA replication and repair protein RecF